jgi:hypothetical protein
VGRSLHFIKHKQCNPLGISGKKELLHRMSLEVEFVEKIVHLLKLKVHN